MNLLALVGLGVFVHLVLLLSVFDIYFSSPIISGIEPVHNPVPPLCRRLVVISVDGLRYDALMENDSKEKPIAPYIRWVMSHKSSWGISHTHLPTESRPGHVAMLAGFYEDPSAVTKGWKENPVDFDSIFNRSVCSFAWGSPDIVNIFYNDLKHDCSFKFTYNDTQDFAGKTWELDNWVWDKVSKFFKSPENLDLYSRDGSVFFLHLLGQDTSGHTHKPNTDLYRYNLRNVDRIVREVDDLFEKVFNDNSTAFILTADHGMTDWGSHGAGDPSETVTPIVAWGKGIKINKPNQLQIDQADITPLLAALLGTSIPVNSVGQLPVSFINSSQATAAQLRLLNVQQISAQYLAKRDQIESKSKFLQFKEFSTFDQLNVMRIISDIKHDIKNGQFAEANAKSSELLKASYAGLDFYQKYFQTSLFVLTTASNICWIAYLLCVIGGVKSPQPLRPFVFISMSVLAAVLCYIVYHESFPVTYYAYVTLPIFLCYLLISANFATNLQFLKANHVFSTVFLLTGIELFVIGFFYRWVWSVILAVLTVWPFFGKIRKGAGLVYICWAISGVLLASFTFVPVVGKQPEPMYNLIASIALCGLTVYYAQISDSGIVGYARAAFILAAGLNSYMIHTQFEDQGGLSSSNQIISFVLLLATVYFLSRRESIILPNLVNAFSSLAIPFILLSTSHESLFLLSLLIHLISWVWLEIDAADMVFGSIQYQEYSRPKLRGTLFTKPDARRAYFFLAYIFIAFFGIGNLATLNSFDPAWVRCFITGFSPFLMTAFIFLKVVVPFFAVCLAFRALTLMLNITPYKTFIAVLIFSNIMSINFLFLVRNSGSWLDIGTSLSHYVIQQITTVFLLALHFASQFVIADPVLRRDKSHFF